MLEKLFPTLASWIDARRTSSERSSTRLSLFRGPTWYVATWFGDSLATHQRSLLRLLSIAHHERLEFAPLVHCLADEHRGRYRWRLRRLAKHLESGTPLVEALEQTPDALSDDAVLALRFGSQSGTLSSAFDMLLPENQINASAKKNQRSLRSYWIVLAISIAILLTFLMAVVAPTFERMFEDFGMELPVTLQILQAIYNVLTEYAALWILVLVIVLGVVSSSAARRVFRRDIAPLFVRPLAQHRTAELLKLLAIGIESGRPINGALSTLARYHFDGRFRQRLLFARNEIEQGVDSWQCLTDANLLTPQQSIALATAPSNEIRAWTLRSLATRKQDLAERRTALGVTLLHPLVILAFGAIVFFIFVSFFSVLITMITSLS